MWITKEKLKEVYSLSLEVNSILKTLSQIPENKLDICLHELAHLLIRTEELFENHYTTIPGNDNFLDLVEHLDVAEYSLAYCPSCKKIKHITAEGCKGLVLFSCDTCGEIVLELFRTEN